MNMKPILEIEHITKEFKIGARKEGYLSLRDQMSNLFRKEDKSSTRFMALNDISFSVNPGESIGIIGRNGAGKSTLLKILSKITPPTSGKIISRGRIASLLEVGTGFHPELSGRENIYMNGSILGMRKAEINKHFDAIVDFSGVEKFLDTPLKRYSSGMQLRLAFAVAAHLEPEILIIDEVLAVGDAEFQRKCLGKMDEVSKSGRTVLFVSHQMGTIAQLCSRGIVLNKGQLVFEGQTQKAIDFYSNNNSNKIDVLSREIEDTTNFQFTVFYNSDDALNNRSEFRHDEPIQVVTEIYCPKKPALEEFALSLYDKNKRRVFTIHEPLNRFYKDETIIKLITKIPPDFLTPGFYSWLMCINEPGRSYCDLQDDICEFSIIDSGSGFAAYEGADYGCVFPNYKMNVLD